MKISFCVTYFNQQDCVARSLDSILKQKMSCDFEILVGDDGSTDDSQKIVQEYQKKYGSEKIKLFIQSREHGKKYSPISRVSANRLNLVSNSTGDYIMFLDGDDWYCHDNFIDESIEILEKDKTLIGIAHSFQKVYSDKTEAEKRFLPDGPISNKKYVSEVYIHVGTYVLRNIFTDKMISELNKTQTFDDNAIVFYLMQYGSVYYIHQVIYSYLQGPKGLWTSISKTEQHLINTLSYPLLTSMAKKYAKYIFMRSYDDLKYIYNHKDELQKLLGDELYQKYVTKATETNNQFALQFLKWEQQNFFKKTKISLWFKFKKIQRKILK